VTSGDHQVIKAASPNRSTTCFDHYLSFVEM
jgi:hypothetical protein